MTRKLEIAIRRSADQMTLHWMGCEVCSNAGNAERYCPRGRELFGSMTALMKRHKESKKGGKP
jgi:hypothetical protein